MSTRRLWWVVLAWLLASCGGGSGDLPPTRPAGTVSGNNAIASAVQNGHIAVYALNRDGKGALLGTAPIDAQGHFSLDLRIPSQPVLIELSGGEYLEEASGVTVNDGEGQVLRSVANYQSGHILSVMVTPLTHLAAALAEYRISQGADPAVAVDTALSTILDVFGISVTDVIPHSISDPIGGTTQLSDPYTYGFFLAALSSFTEWVSLKNNVPVHSVYNSMSLSQVMYNDIRSDGRLDGRGLNKAGDAMMDLALGTVPLNQDVYRIAIAQHLIAVSTTAVNKTGLGRDDLRDVALKFSTNANALFGGKAPKDTSAFAPGIVPKLAPGSTFNGVYNFEVAISGVLGAEHVSFDIDGVAIGDAIDPAQPAVAIDTRGYADGEYSIGVTATDFLGLTSYQVFTYNFDNVFVNLSSSPATNHTPFTLTGTYGDNGFGLKSLTVQGKTVTPNADKTWSIPVDLNLGRNHIPIVLETLNGITITSDAIVDYDVGAPVITAAVHGNGCFSDGFGSCNIQALADRNEGAPLMIMTNHTELAGVALTRKALGNNSIPYFALVASDPLINGVATDAAQLKVRMQYEKNGNVVVPWFTLTAVDGEYLLPLVTEILSDTWLRSAPTDIHALRVEVEDLAGNTSGTLLTFKTDFVVAPFAMDAVIDSGNAAIASTAFADRASLYGTTVTMEEYPFTNTTGKGFYISPGDSSVHGVDNLIDQLVRENKVRLKTATEWRAGFIENVLIYNECPSLPATWTSVTQILNYVGSSGWNPVTPPAATYGAIQAVTTDSPTAPTPSNWSQVPYFDNIYAVGSADISGSKLVYVYDDIMSQPTFSKPAVVRNWKFTDSTGKVTVCPDVNFLQQRQVFSYQSEPGYPQNIASTTHDSASFVTSGFSVFDVTANASITPVSGWYLIPAGHAVVVSKQVTLPALTLHNDTDVADPGSFTSYTPHLYDRTLTWTIERPMTMDVAHDGGAGNLFSMTSRQVQAGVGAANYQLSR